MPIGNVVRPFTLALQQSKRTLAGAAQHKVGSSTAALTADAVRHTADEHGAHASHSFQSSDEVLNLIHAKQPQTERLHTFASVTAAIHQGKVPLNTPRQVLSYLRAAQQVFQAGHAAPQLAPRPRTTMEFTNILKAHHIGLKPEASEHVVMAFAHGIQGAQGYGHDRAPSTVRPLAHALIDALTPRENTGIAPLNLTPHQPKSGH